MKDVVDMYASGMSCADIAAKKGWRHAETARYHLKRAGVVMRPRSYKKPKPVPSWEAYFAGKTRQDGGCILWTGAVNHLGYGSVQACFAPGINTAHRMSYFIANGPFDLKMRVLHRCDVRNCVNPDHLWLGTQQDNIADMVAKGRQRSGGTRGEDNHYSKLTENEVLRMRTMRGLNLSYQKIARHFGVSTMTAYRACVGQAWAHLEGATND